MKKYNGWFNRDTWLVALWLDNDINNYTRLWEQKSELVNLTDEALKKHLTTYHYGDRVNFEAVNWSEIHEMIAEYNA